VPDLQTLFFVFMCFWFSVAKDERKDFFSFFLSLVWSPVIFSVLVDVDFDQLGKLAHVGELLSFSDDLTGGVHLVEDVPGEHPHDLAVLQVVDNSLAVLVVIIMANLRGGGHRRGLGDSLG